MARRGYRRPSEVNEGEESYFISMTDILVGLLFIFIILIVFAILVAQENQEIKERQNQAEQLETILLDLASMRQKLKEAEEEQERTQKKLDRTSAMYAEIAKGAEKRERDRASVVQGVFQSLVDDGFKGIMPLAEKGILRFTGEGTFASGEWDLPIDSEGFVLFSAVSERLAERVACFAYRDKADLGLFDGSFMSSAKVVEGSEIKTEDGRFLVIYGRGCEKSKNAFLQNLMIVGHTDKVPMRGMDNLQLSALRALSVYRLMVEKTPVLSRYYNMSGEPIISFSGYGEDRPVENNSTPAGQSANRRTDLRIIMDSPKIVDLEDPFSAQ